MDVAVLGIVGTPPRLVWLKLRVCVCVCVCVRVQI